MRRLASFNGMATYKLLSIVLFIVLKCHRLHNLVKLQATAFVIPANIFSLAIILPFATACRHLFMYYGYNLIFYPTWPSNL